MPYAFTQLSVPAGWTTGIGRQCKWSPSGNYLLATSSATPFAKMFTRSGDVLSSGTALGTLPVADTTSPEWAGTVDQAFMLFYFATPNYSHSFSFSGGSSTKVTDFHTFNSAVNRYSPDGQYVLTPGPSPSWLDIFKNNPATGAVDTTRYNITSYGGTGVAPNTTVWDVAFSPDNTKMVLGTSRSSHTVQAYDVTAKDDSAKTIAFNHHGYDNTFILNAQITSIKFHPTNNRYFIICSNSSTSGFAGAHLYDMGTSTSSGTKKIASLTGISATEVAQNAEWSADGTMLAVAFAGTLGVWSFDDTTATFSNKSTQDISSFSTTNRCTIYKADAATAYVAVSHSTSATNAQLSLWKVAQGNNVDVHAKIPQIKASASLNVRSTLKSSAKIPQIKAKANLAVNGTLRTHTKLPQIKARAVINSYVPDFPATYPYRLLSQIVVAPGDAQVTFEPYDGTPGLIDANYSTYGAAITGHEYLSVNIGAVYSGYQALLMDRSEGSIDAVYAGYEAAIDFQNFSWAPTIDAIYAEYGADIEGDWPFGTLIDAQYTGYVAAIDADIPYGLPIAATYSGYQAAIDADIPIGLNIGAVYGTYAAGISAKQIYDNTYIFASYPTYEAALVATRIPAIAAVYPTYQVAIDGDVQSGFNISAQYSGYQAALHGQFPMVFTTAAIYPTYGADIRARGSYMIDANVRYAGYQAALYTTVPTEPTEIEAVYSTYGAQIITHYYQPEYLGAVYSGYQADIVGDIGHPLNVEIDATYQGYQASLLILLYEQIFVDALYPAYGADIEVQYVPKRKRQIYLVQPV